MKKESPIGFFDSGVGGLSVFSKFCDALPSENLMYFGDLKNLPYGNKTQGQLISYAKNILNFFEKKGVKAVVIACNTSSALAYEAIKNDYNFEIYPIIQSCAKLISEMNLPKIGVFATQGTVNSSAYKKEITKHNSKVDVVEIACPNWVNIVETGSLDEESSISDIKNKLEEMLLSQPDKIILGCTHYPYLLNILEKYATKDLFIDPARIFVEYIANDLRNKNLLNDLSIEGNKEFYVSANPKSFVENAKLFYDVKTLPEIVEFV